MVAGLVIGVDLDLRALILSFVCFFGSFGVMDALGCPVHPPSAFAGLLLGQPLAFAGMAFFHYYNVLSHVGPFLALAAWQYPLLG